MNTIYTNLYQVLNMATNEHYEQGVKWYDDARAFCHVVAIETNTSFMVTCAVLAALSPRNKWERNKKDCFELCKGNTSHKFGTFHANVNKARKIMACTNEQEIVRTLNGKKIIAFFDNISNENSERVTVDVWMLLAAMGNRLVESERPNLTQSLYDDIENSLFKIAQENKLRPYEAQAIIWLTFREVA